MTTFRSSILKTTYIVIGFTVTMEVNSCKHTTEPNDETNYPAVLAYSNERNAAFMNTWKKFNQKYNLNIPTPTIDSVLMVPEWLYLSTIYGFQINLFPDRDGLIPLDDVRTRLKAFIDEWGILFSCSSTELQELYAQKEPSFSGSIYYFRFVKNNSYELKTIGWTSRIISQIDSTGKLRGISSTCLPTLPVPVIQKSRVEKRSSPSSEKNLCMEIGKETKC